MNKFLCAILMLVSSLAGAQSGPTNDSVRVDSNLFSGLEARNVGPATMSGRVAAIDGVMVKDRLTLYVGAASGGVWKSENGGTTFKPVFDNTRSPSARSPSIPISQDRMGGYRRDLGTEQCLRRHRYLQVHGWWRELAVLRPADSEHIAKIIVDPRNSNTVWHAR